MCRTKTILIVEERIVKRHTCFGWQHYFRLKQLINYPIPQLTLVISASISSIGYPSASMVGIGEGPDAFLVTDNKVSIGNPMSSVPGPNVQIESYRYQLPSVTECPRLTYNLYIFGKHYLNGIDNVQNFGISKLPKPIPKVKFRPILKLIVSLITQKQTNI